MSTGRQARADARKAMRAAGIQEDKIAAVLELMARPRFKVHITRVMKAAIEGALARDRVATIVLHKSGKSAELVSKEFVTIAPRRHFEKPGAVARAGKARKKRKMTPEGLKRLREGMAKTRAILEARKREKEAAK